MEPLLILKNFEEEFSISQKSETGLFRVHRIDKGGKACAVAGFPTFNKAINYCLKVMGVHPDLA